MAASETQVDILHAVMSKASVGNAVGPYTIVRELGPHGDGMQYVAKNDVGAYVALTVILLEEVDKDTITHIKREISLAKSVNHENIAEYITTVHTDTAAVLVYEFSKRGSLEDALVAKQNPFNEYQCGKYIIQALIALEHLHQMDIVHLDIRAANMILTDRNKIKLYNFLISRNSEDVQASPYWMAPEFVDVSVPAGPSCDVWSLACTTIELFTGKPPYAHLDPVDALYKMVGGSPPIPGNTSPKLQDFLKQCFNLDPASRPSARDLLSHPWVKSIMERATNHSTADFFSDEMFIDGPPEMESTPLFAIGTYQLFEKMGEGAYGRVFRGFDIKSGMTVAVKRFDLSSTPQEVRKALEHEVRVMKAIKHRHCMKMIDAIEKDDTFNIIVELAERGSLVDIMNRKGKFTEGQIKIFVPSLLEAIDHIHSVGLIHRDIKGSNVLFTNDYTLKLGDFGAAIWKDTATQDDLEGSPYWLAPEVFDESIPQTPASDIWALGCTVIEAFTGKPPYSHLEPTKAMMRIVMDPHPPFPDGISDSMLSFLQACFVPDPDSRFSAKQLLRHRWVTSALDGTESINKTRRISQRDQELLASHCSIS